VAGIFVPAVTAKDPDKNLCRDVSAERLRRVITGYGGKPGYSAVQGGEFAYLQLDLLAAADVAFEATPSHAATLLYMKNTALAPVNTAQAAIYSIAIGDDWLTVLCHDATPETRKPWPPCWPSAASRPTPIRSPRRC